MNNIHHYDTDHTAPNGLLHWVESLRRDTVNASETTPSLVVVFFEFGMVLVACLAIALIADYALAIG